LDEAYKVIKDWKAKQKADFIEAVAGEKLTTLDFREKFPLFDTSDKIFLEFCRLTKELDLNPENAKEIAQNRGAFFNKPGIRKQKTQTQNYYELCELYKRIAMKRGKILAEIKGLENEEVQSQVLDHWAVILKENEKQFLVIIPRGEHSNHKKAHKFLEKYKDKNNDGEIILYHFKSLTLRALEKLCFKEQYENTFMPALKKEGIRFPQYKEEWRENQEWKLIKFYKEILKSNYAKKYLDLVDFGGLENFLKTPFKKLEEFESALEKACYVKIPLKFSAEKKDQFIETLDAKVFEITTRSIEGKKKENRHTEIWNEFWTRKNEEYNYITRLNPELSVFYREALDKNEENQNRYSKEQFTLATTISLNATKKKSNLAFKTTKDIKDHIKKFNKEFEEKNNNDLSENWYFGIDRGLKELATLNVVKFSNKKNGVRVSQAKEFAQIEV
jgi:hypothetical protein